jgi:ABC-type phosphate transport system permease subunit
MIAAIVAIFAALFGGAFWAIELARRRDSLSVPEIVFLAAAMALGVLTIAGLVLAASDSTRRCTNSARRGSASSGATRSCSKP